MVPIVLRHDLFRATCLSAYIMHPRRQLGLTVLGVYVQL